MKVPKYIREAIRLRARYAILFNKYDYIVSDFCDKHDIDCEMIHGHVETIVNPERAARDTLKDIEGAQNK